MPSIQLNGRSYNVKDGEFKPLFHAEYNNLKLFPDAGHLERHIGLLTDLTDALEEVPDPLLCLYEHPLNSDPVLECVGSSHGLFVPINCSKAYESVWINPSGMDHDLDLSQIDLSDLSNVSVGLPLKPPSVVYVADPSANLLATVMDAYVLCPASVALGLSHSFKFPLASDPFGYTLCVPDSRRAAFDAEFASYFSNGEFKYDNLIHLCIMVKNGGTMFERVLQENLPYIDCWTVLDTGSTDGTQDVVRRILKDKKGELYEEPFINFRDSRNRCLELASSRCKYTLMLDDTYVIRGDLRKFLTLIRSDQFANSYSLLILSDDTEYYSNRVLKSVDKLRYIYTIHEVIQQKDNVTVVIPKDQATIFDYRADYMEKRTMDRKRYDLDRLFDMLAEDPDNPRHLYYLGQTYNLLEDWESAAKYFELRATSKLEGFKQEAVDSYFELARLYNFKLGKPWALCEETYRKAYDLDPSRPDPLYFIGIHYLMEGQKEIAFDHFKRAFQLGYPVHAQFSLKPTLSYYFLPKFLASLCYEFEDYRLGLRACQLFLEKGVMVAKKEAIEADVVIMRDWNTVFQHLCQMPSLTNPTYSTTPLFVFVADGGWGPWTGRDILTKGMGGSETYIVEMARYIQASGSYQVIVFCRCLDIDVFEGVQYRPIESFHSFVANTTVETCVISRYSEYLPVAIRGHVENVYLVLHDLGPTGLIIPLHKKLKRVFCLTEWHKQYFLKGFPMCEGLVDVFSYGLDQNRFPKGIGKKPHSFLYSSFPNRGLLPLLQMWPRIVDKWPDATLEVFCDLDHEWTNRVAGDVVVAIRSELAKGLKGVTVRGWASKADLASAWMSTDIWLYPCTFQETFCLTALEAAYSGCLIVCSDLAALQNTVGNRGIMIPGNPMSLEWQERALEALFSVGERKKDLVERGRQWASDLTWKGQAQKFLDLYCKNNTNTGGMYNWTHDLPKGSRGIFEQMLSRHRGAGTRLLEIGTFAGTSLIEMLKILPEATAVAIDRWTNYDEDGIITLANQEQGGIEQVFHENMRKAGLSSRVIALKGDSVDRLLDLVQEKALFDFIYVDGSHKCIDCYTDMALSWRLLKNGGTMIVDDYLYRHDRVASGLVLEYPMKGVDHFLSKYEGAYRVLDKGYRVCLEKI